MNIFVGCASRDTENEVYNKIAEEIGNFIVNGKHNFVFGGCSSGLMGKIYSVVSKSSESKVIISMARAYADELQFFAYKVKNIDLLDTISERKDSLIELSDVIIFIPGGIGTFDEIFSAIETKRSHEHNKPIIIINVNNYFESLLDMLEKIYSEGFADIKNKELYYFVNSFEEAIEYIK